MTHAEIAAPVKIENDNIAHAKNILFLVQNVDAKSQDKAIKSLFNEARKYNQTPETRQVAREALAQAMQSDVIDPSCREKWIKFFMGMHPDHFMGLRYGDLSAAASASAIAGYMNSEYCTPEQFQKGLKRINSYDSHREALGMYGIAEYEEMMTVLPDALAQVYSAKHSDSKSQSQIIRKLFSLSVRHYTYDANQTAGQALEKIGKSLGAEKYDDALYSITTAQEFVDSEYIQDHKDHLVRNIALTAEKVVGNDVFNGRVFSKNGETVTAALPGYSGAAYTINSKFQSRKYSHPF